MNYFFAAAIIVVTSIGLVGVALYARPIIPTDCTKMNNNVRGSIEYRCACK